MTKARPSNLELDRLIEMLNDGHPSLTEDEFLAQLSDEQRREFKDAQQAIRILDEAVPVADKSPKQHPSLAETPAIQKAETQVDSVDQGFELPPIQNLGHYQVLETLGQGGFGIVVKARDSKLLRTVALKIPRFDRLLKESDGRERFVREARLVAMLSHPAIVPIYETGIEGPFLFIASAYCNGGTLAQWFSKQQKNIAPSLAAKIVSRLAEAVQHAHQRGVVHRDLKPGNVLLDIDGNSTELNDESLVNSLRITDFGLAKFLDEDATVTQSGDRIGTPAYMSPEQARGAVEEIGSASDIYGLGAILYELLTGQPPIVGNSIVATMRAIENQSPTAPVKINPRISLDLSAICLKCLEKNPKHRYANAQELQSDLGAFLHGKPVQARPIGRATRLARWGQRNPAIAVALTFAISALVIGLAFSISFGISANRATKLADLKSAEALNQAELAHQAVDRLQRAIANEPKLRGDGFEKFKVSLAAAASDYYEVVSTQQPNDPDVLKVYIKTLTGLAYLQQLVGQHDDAITIWNQAAEVMQREFPDNLIGWAAIRSKLAEDLLFTGKTDEAVEITNDLVARLNQELLESGSDDVLKNLIAQLVSAAQNLNHQGDSNRAELLIDDAIGLVNLTNGVTPEDWPTSRLPARVLRCKTETALALRKHEDIDQFAPLAINLYSSLMADDPDRTSEALDSMASIHQSLGVSKHDRGLFEDALAEFEKEKTLMQDLMRRHPDVAGLSFNWSNHIHRHANALFESGESEKASELMLPHLDWLKAKQQQYPQLIHMLRISEVECRGLMSDIDADLNRPESSAQQLDMAIDVCEEACESEQVLAGLKAYLGKLYTQKSRQLLATGETEAALDWLNQSIEILEPVVAESSGGDASKFLAEARALLQQSDENR